MSKSFAFAGDKVIGDIVSRKLAAAGFPLASNVAAADYIFTYCLAQSQAEDIYLGSAGLVEMAPEGCCFIDLSPSTTTLAKELYAMARVNEMQSLDAPLVIKDVCAHDAFGDSSNVMLLVGGDDDAYQTALPLLQTLSDDIRYMGVAGLGQLAKSMVTVQQAGSVVSLVEAYALAKSQNEQAADAISVAIEAGIVAPESRALYQAITDEHFHGSYSCAVIMAELTAVLEGAEETDLALPQTEACERLLELFLVVGGSDLPVAALSLVYASQEDAEKHGIDWSRAEDVYGHEHDDDVHEHAHDESTLFDYEEVDYDYDPEDEGGYAGGFGGFSAN